MTDFTLFGNPFLNAIDIMNIVYQAWKFMQNIEQTWAKRTDEYNIMVNKHKLFLIYNVR